MNKLWQILDNSLLKIAVIFSTVFIVLYPKLPSIYITHTWVYIRAEDFVIAATVGIWLVQVLRKKVSIPWRIGWPIGLYWVVGFASLLFCFAFIAPHLLNFFPKVAALEGFRRVEYLVLFFVAFSSIKSAKDVKDYIIGVFVATAGVALYGIGQHFYLTLWQAFPKFFEKFPFCFPSFQTGNEEFAKGIPLCLPSDARTTSLFGGSYDLGAYLVFVMPLIISGLFIVKRWTSKIAVGALFLASLMLLIFTASRVSFTSYVIGAIFSLIFLGKKKAIIPVLAVSFIVLLVFSGSTAKRFMETFRFTTIVTNNQGQVVGVAQNTLPTDLQKKISKNPVVVSAPPPSQNLPTGSSFITLPTAPQATSVAVVKSSVSSGVAKKLKLAYGGVEISTVSGSFLVQKALVYDISFTTRFQGEWPRDWAAFMSNPPLGTGYGSLSLASDNDYLRALGETGFLGLGSFILIFVVLGIFLKYAIKDVEDPWVKGIALGLAGGIVGLFINASLIDVFEASKVAEPLWMILGVATAGVMLFNKREIPYKKDLLAIVTSTPSILTAIFVATFVVFMQSINNFFAADDFTWLHWAAASSLHTIPTYFTNAQGFFYRPFDKIIVFGLYTLLSFQPQGYHIFGIFLHAIMTLGVFVLLRQIFNRKIFALAGALLFMILPVHAENLYWFATLSTTLSAIGLIYALTLFVRSRRRNGIISYVISVIFAIFAVFTYEMGAIWPLLLIITDCLLLGRRLTKKVWLSYVPFVVIDLIYFVLRQKSGAAGFSGDYSYNLIHFVPNFFGNLLGYFGLFVAGWITLPWFGFLREATRGYALLVGIILVLILTGIGWSIRKNVITFEWRKISVWLYGLGVVVVGLLPFIGLGNITERYGYFASVGFVILVVLVLRKFYKTKIWDTKLKTIIVLCAGVLIVVFYSNLLSKEQSDWGKAGDITKNTLAYFRVAFEGLPPGSSVIVANMPTRIGNAWVFPVGFSDGLWFIYRDDSLRVYKVATIQEGKALLQSMPKKEQDKAFLFSFDKNNQIKSIE